MHSQGYGGPSLLSRGGNQPGHRGRGPVNFNYYAAIRGTYDTGLIAPTLDEAGNLTPLDIYGGQVEAGAYGAKSWSKSSLGLDYRGDYRKYNRGTNFDGSNQVLSLDFNFRPTRRTTLFFRETAGTTNRAFGGFAAPAFADEQNIGVPLNEVFDSRLYFSQTTGGVGYQPSARSVYTVAADAFFVKRTSLALIGMQGYRVSGTYTYRLSRSDTIGLNYNFMRMEFPRIYGDSVVHTIAAQYQRRVSRNLNLSMNAGVLRAETRGTQQVQLSPEVAAILGRPTGVEAFRRIAVGPQLDLRAIYTKEHSSFTASVNSGISAGNGIYITSQQRGARAGYSYTGVRKLSLGLSAGYTRFSSLGLRLGNYTNVQGGGGMSYRLTEYLNLSAQYDRRKFDSPAVRGRNGSSVTVGLSFSGSRLPLSIW